MPDKIAVSPEQAAQLANLPVRTIYYALAGKTDHPLPSAKIGKRRIILVDDLKSWIGEFTKERAQ